MGNQKMPFVKQIALPLDFSFCYCILKIYRSLSLSLFVTPSLGHKGRRYNLKSSPSEGRAFAVLLVANRNVGIPDGANGV